MSEIVERTREARFEELFREHYRAVRGYALRRAPGDLAQDAVSETFLVAWRRLDDVPADGCHGCTASRDVYWPTNAAQSTAVPPSSGGWQQPPV